MFFVFGKQAHHGGVEAKVRDAAENEDPGPDEDVNAVVVAPDPAGHDDLGEIEQGGASDTQPESCRGVALCAGAIAVPAGELREHYPGFCDHSGGPGWRRCGRSCPSARG